MPYQLMVAQTFDAAHRLIGYPGNCANTHGHTWKVEVIITGQQLDSLGILVDFRDIRRQLAEILEQFDHNMINEIAPFDETNPTAENLACYIYRQINKQLAGCRVKQVKVWESEFCWASFDEEEI